MVRTYKHLLLWMLKCTGMLNLMQKSVTQTRAFSSASFDSSTNSHSPKRKQHCDPAGLLDADTSTVSSVCVIEVMSHICLFLFRMATTIIYYQYWYIAGFWLSVDFNLLVFVLCLIILFVLKAKHIYISQKKLIHKNNYINPYYV